MSKKNSRVEAGVADGERASGIAFGLGLLRRLPSRSVWGGSWFASGRPRTGQAGSPRGTAGTAESRGCWASVDHAARNSGRAQCVRSPTKVTSTSRRAAAWDWPAAALSACRQ